MDGYEVKDGSSESTHGRGEVHVTIGCVTILKHGVQELVSVECTLRVGVVSDEVLHGLDGHLSAAVAVGEGNEGDVVAHSPVAQKSADDPCRKLGVTI